MDPPLVASKCPLLHNVLNSEQVRNTAVLTTLYQCPHSRVEELYLELPAGPVLHLLDNGGDELRLERDLEQRGVVLSHVDHDDIVLQRRQAHLNTIIINDFTFSIQQM